MGILRFYDGVTRRGGGWGGLPMHRPGPRECAIGGQRASSRGARHHCGSLQGREIIDKDSARAQPGRRHVLAGTLRGMEKVVKKARWRVAE